MAESFKIIGDVKQFGGRDVVRVQLADGSIQAFYRSTGANSGMPGEWLPVSGISPVAGGDWFNKSAYMQGAAGNPSDPLYRYGNQRLKDVGQSISKMALGVGTTQSATQINAWIGTSEALKFNQQFAAINAVNQPSPPQTPVPLPPAPPPPPPPPAFRVTQGYSTWNVYDPNNQPMGRFPSRAAADQWVNSQSPGAPPQAPPSQVPPPPGQPSFQYQHGGVGYGSAAAAANAAANAAAAARVVAQPPPPPSGSAPTPGGWQPIAGAAAGGATGGVGSMVGAGIGMAMSGGNPLGAMAGAMVGRLSEEALRLLIAAPKALHAFVEETGAATRRLALFDAQIGLASAQLMLGDFNRNLALAKYTAPTGAELLRAINRMRDAFIPWQVATTNLANTAAQGGAGLLGGIAGGASIIPQTANWILKAIDPNGNLAGNIGQAIGNQFGQSLVTMLIPGLGPVGAVIQPHIWKKITDAIRGALGIPNIQAGGGARGAWDNFTRDVAAGRGPGPATPIHGGFILAPWKDRGQRQVDFGNPEWWFGQ